MSADPSPCASGCGFSGNPSTGNMCSSCWRKLRVARGDDVEAEEAAAKAVMDRHKMWERALTDAAAAGDEAAFRALVASGSPKHGHVGAGMSSGMAYVMNELQREVVRGAKTSIFKLMLELGAIDFQAKPMEQLLSHTRHSYMQKRPTDAQLEFFNYLLSLPQVVEKLDAEQLSLAVYTHGGDPFIERLVTFTEKIQVTKTVLDSAKFLCKRPQNVPSPESFAKIAIVEAAYKAREERLKAQRAAPAVEEPPDDEKKEVAEAPAPRGTRSKGKKQQEDALPEEGTRRTRAKKQAPS